VQKTPRKTHSGHAGKLPKGGISGWSWVLVSDTLSDAIKKGLPDPPPEKKKKEKKKKK